MNDFTKEELKIILETYHLLGGVRTDCERSIMNKIRKIIDSDCEHQWVKDFYGTCCKECGIYE